MTQPGDDIADQIGRLAAGNQALINNPSVLNGLVAAGASPAQAQSTNLFLTGIAAQQQIADTPPGYKAPLTAQQQAAVALTGGAPAQAPSGPPKYVKVEPTNDNQWGWSAAKKNLDTLGNMFSDFYNAISGGVQLASDTIHQVVAGENSSQQDPDRYAAAASQGYDLNNGFSAAAYYLSGKSFLKLDDLYDDNSPALVNQAIQYTDNPDAFLQQVYTKYGETQNPADLQLLDTKTPQGKQFQDLAMQVQARRTTFGNLATLGIDPVKHPTEHRIAAGTVDTAVSFLIDPTLIATKGIAALRMSEIGLDSIGDGTKVRAVISGDAKGMYAAQVRTGVKSFITDTTKMRTAAAAGDHATAAAALAHIHAATPGLEHLIDDFNGAVINGEGKIIDHAEPITTMAAAADYLSSKAGLVRYLSGRAGAEIGLMPGQLSRFGAKALRANLAAAAVGRGSRKVIDLTKPAVLDRFLPKPGDAVDTATGRVISDVDAEAPTTAQLASQLRAAAAGRGEQRFAALKGSGVAGKVTAAFLRTQRSIQRATTFLPRTTTFDIANPNMTRDVVNYAKTYLTASDANLLGSAYAAADSATRKAILSGLGLQVAHAAGLGTTSGGRDLLAILNREFTTHQYSVTAGTFIDHATGMERDAALWPSDVREVLTLPSFRTLQQQAAKIGIWENTLGKVFNAPVVDSLLKVTRALWLLRPTNVVRNSAEDLFGAYLRGELSHVLLAKRVADEAGLLPSRTRLGNSIMTPLLATTRMYAQRRIASAADKLGLDYIAKLPADELKSFADDFMAAHVGSMIDANGSADLQRIADAQLRPARLTFNARRTGFSEQDATGGVGALRYSAHLGRVINGNRELVMQIVNTFSLPADVRKLMGPRKFTVDDVVKTLRKDPRTKDMIRAVQLKDARGTIVKAVTDAQKAVALRQLADKQIHELRTLLSNPDGELNEDLIRYVGENEAAPDADWIRSNLPDDKRPAAVLAPTFEAVAKQPGITGFVADLADLSGKAYTAMIEKPITRISTMPIFLSNYGKMRVFLRPLEAEHIAGGLSEKAADAAVGKLAMQMAWTRTIKYIDDPTLRTQLDVVGRNFFAFSRATQAFIRRWSTQLLEDPARLRKAMLTYEGAERTGLVYKDPDGNSQFVFPGSGAAINALMRVQDLIPGLNLVRIPGVTPNLTSRVAFLNPGLANPLQFSLTPLVNIPMREVEKLVPASSAVMMDKIDGWLNGSSGQGASPLSEFEPSALRQFSDAAKTDKDSLTADAMRAAALNLNAAGKFPAQLTDAQGNPLPVDSAQVQEFLTNLEAQTQNQMVYRALFGLFTPAPPGAPTEENSAAAADWFYGAQGIHGMDDEWKKILNDTGDYPLALQIWTQLHPDKLAFTVPTTEVGTKNAIVQATSAANTWILHNADFLKAYKGVGAYFLPQAANQGEFDNPAYRSELRLQLRQHKDTADFVNDVTTAQASSAFYGALAVRDETLAEHPDKKSTITANFSAWEKDFYAKNPIFAASQQDSATSAATAADQLDQLRRLVNDPKTPADVPVTAVKQMIDTYDVYHQTLDSIQGETNAADAARATVGGNYDAWFQQFLKENPDLGGLYSGVFRTLDNKVLDPVGSTS